MDHENSETSPTSPTKRPTWATIVGTLAIIFGIFGMLGGVKDGAMPSMVDMQKHVMGQLTKTPEGMSKEGERARQQFELQRFIKSINTPFSLPDWYRSWAIVIGGITTLIAFFYLLAGLFLLMTKSYAIAVIYSAIAASVVRATVLAVIYSLYGSGMLSAQIPGFFVSVVIDVILLAVVFTGKKPCFTAQPTA